MMTAIASERELFRSCEILFGMELSLSREFLLYLQPSGIKSAYRQKARETHPDLACATNDSEKKHRTDLFVAVQDAYENLKSYLDAREKGYRIPTRPTGNTANGCRPARHADTPKRPAGSTWRDDYTAGRRPHQTAWDFDTAKKHQGEIPNRTLLFGHFLYYSGEITWRDIVQALVWQRNQRPRLGEIGRQLGWLTERDILRILERRSPTQPFGATAVRLGLLDATQLNALVLRQKRLQKKIGSYFLEEKRISAQRLQHLIIRHQLHNSKMTSTAGACQWA